MSIDDQRWRAIELCDVKAAETFVYGQDSNGTCHSPICRNRRLFADTRSGGSLPVPVAEIIREPLWSLASPSSYSYG